MNFDLSEDEAMLKALAERFVTDHYDHEGRREFLARPCGFSQENWNLLGELGLVAALLPEDAGGLGLDATGIATVFEALGKGLVVEPLADAVVLAARLFAATAPQELAGQWLEALVTGEKRLALAHAEAGTRGTAIWIETCAEAGADGGAVLNGAKPYCVTGCGADGYVVSARTSGAPDAAEGAGLYFVAADAAGLEATRWHLADGSVAVALVLDGVAAVPLDGGMEAIAEAELIAGFARSAEALGIMERLFAETLDYIRTRDQFGVAIGSFQAIQHRMVAQYAALEQSRALLEKAQVAWGTKDFARAANGARAYIGAAGVALGHEMIQFHGGMGVTDELAIGGGHKRLLTIARWPEDSAAALDRFAGLRN